MISMNAQLTQPYDINFCFSVPPVLESERVLLTPFIPSEHAQSFISASFPHPEMFDYLPFGPFKDVEDLVDNLIESRIRQDPALILFAIIDKSRSTDSEARVLAGAIGFLNSSPVHMFTEMGFVMIFPPFQRSHIASNAAGILLQYALDTPSHGGLGLRRVLWQTNSYNASSINLAKRLGFHMEGVLRWDRVLPQEKKVGNSMKLRDDDPKPKQVGRDTVMLSLCWDDWENGGREHTGTVIARIK